MLSRRTRLGIVFSFLFSVLTLSFQNCGQKLDFAVIDSKGPVITFLQKQA